MKYAPCIRLIEVLPEKKCVLHIITVLGARIGFGKTCDIMLKSNFYNCKYNDILYISYKFNETEMYYEMTCCLEQNKIELLNLQINQEKVCLFF